MLFIGDIHRKDKRSRGWQESMTLVAATLAMLLSVGFQYYQSALRNFVSVRQ